MVEPRTVFEDAAQVRSGSEIAVRGAGFPAGGELRGAVLVTFRVPAEMFRQHPEGDASASVFLSASEARGLAEWLDKAAAATDRVGPPLYP